MRSFRLRSVCEKEKKSSGNRFKKNGRWARYGRSSYFPSLPRVQPHWSTSLHVFCLKFMNFGREAVLERSQRTNATIYCIIKLVCLDRSLIQIRTSSRHLRKTERKRRRSNAGRSEGGRWPMKCFSVRQSSRQIQKLKMGSRVKANLRHE